MMLKNEYFMNIALKEAKKAYRINEVPVGAVVIENNKIIAKAHNQMIKDNNCTAHAEILALKIACKKKKIID